MGRFGSRKFLVALGGMLTAIGGALSGALDWPDAMRAITAIAIAYFAAQGAPDAVEAFVVGRTNAECGAPNAETKVVGAAGKPVVNLAKRGPTLFVLIGLVGLAGLASGCSSFRVYDPVSGQPMVTATGAPLLNRKDGFRVEREWLDGETNVLHSFTVERNTDENADAQVRALELVGEAWAARVAGAP